MSFSNPKPQSQPPEEVNYPPLKGGERILLLVNGYRQNHFLFSELVELPNSNNDIHTVDYYQYWGEMGQLLTNHFDPQQTYYADGHFSIQTSNHKTFEQFVKSLMSSLSVAGMMIHQSEDFMKIYHKEAYVVLNTTPHLSGFNRRRDSGKIGALNWLNKTQLHHISITRPVIIDVVSHSMGYAYSLGMIDIFKTSHHIKLGKMYTLAPENPSSGKINPHDFEEVWQFGSKDTNPHRDMLWEQDGLAPQSSIFDTDDFAPNAQYGRLFIPKEYPHRNFVAAHLLHHYTWIFEALKAAQKRFV